MSALERLLAEARNLSGSAAGVEELQAFIDDLFGELLIATGPPVDPIPDFSEDLRTGIVRSPKGHRLLAVARTWTTGPWRCVLVESPSVPMGRGIFIPRDPEAIRKKDRFTVHDFKVITPSRTQGAIRRIVGACRELGLEPIGQGAVHMVLGDYRTFIAWRPLEQDEAFNAGLRGDVDNYAKTVLDGLQGAGVLPNDRGVGRLSAAKDQPPTWSAPPAPLEEVLRNDIVDRRLKGQDLETIRLELRLSRKHMQDLFPGEYVARDRRKDPNARDEAARQAVELIRSGLPYGEARTRAGASATIMRPLLATMLRPRVIDDDTLTLQTLAHELGLDTRTMADIFREDTEVRTLFRSRSSRNDPNKLAAAIAAAKDGMPASQAAREHGVSLSYLRVALARNTSPLRKRGRPAKKKTT